jgi:hypothetical protein
VEEQYKEGIELIIDKFTNSSELRLILNILNYRAMGLIKEPKGIDLSTKSEPWTEQELIDFRKIMQGTKAKNAK